MARQLEHSLAVGNVGEDDHNTIVLPGVDVVVPLELDLDHDPLQDDEVRLRSIDGSWERVLLISDRDVEHDEEKRLAFYRFRDVPFGCYDLSVRVGARWCRVLRRMLVTVNGVLGPAGELDDAPPEPAGAPPPPPEEEEEQLESLNLGEPPYPASPEEV